MWRPTIGRVTAGVHRDHREPRLVIAWVNRPIPRKFRWQLSKGDRRFATLIGGRKMDTTDGDPWKWRENGVWRPINFLSFFGIYTFYLVGIDLLEHFLPDELCSVLITEALRVLWDIMGCCIVNFGNFLNRFQLKFLVAVDATRSIFPTVLLVITIVTSVDSRLLNKEKKTGKFQESREKEWLVKKFLLLHGRRETGTEPRLGHPFNLRPIPNTVASPTWFFLNA